MLGFTCGSYVQRLGAVVGGAGGCNLLFLVMLLLLLLVVVDVMEDVVLEKLQIIVKEVIRCAGII